MRSLLAYYAEAVMTAAARGAGCALGCSGRGDCMNGTCLCEIRYAGDECAAPNLPYHACIGGVFLLVAFVCAVQLTICVVTEYRRLKAPSFLRACKVTTQKMLYLVAFLASLIRGAYFVSPSAFQEGWATSLLSAYYPLLMSGSSLIVCFWAEEEAPIELYTDASSLGYGAVLVQIIEGRQHPIAYMSQRTTDVESRYHSYELETLAVVRAIKHFRQYLYGRKFKVITDCNALKASKHKKDLLPRVHRWWAFLQNYDFEVEYRKGERLQHADFFSRNPSGEFSANSLTRDTDWIQIEQRRDDNLRSIIDDPTPGYEVEDGVLKKVFIDPVLGTYKVTVIPRSFQWSIINSYHTSLKHPGWEKTLQKLKESYWFDKMSTVVRNFVDNCVICRTSKNSSGAVQVQLHPIQKPTAPFQVIHMDITGKLGTKDSQGRDEYVIVIIDAYTKYILLYYSTDKSQSSSLAALKRLIHLFATPIQVVVDGGREFLGEFKTYCDRFGIDIHSIAPGVSRANGQVERVMGTLKNALTMIKNYDTEKWQVALEALQLAFNCTAHRVTGVAPLTLLTRRQHCVPPELLSLVNIESEVIDFDLLEQHVQEKMAASAKYEKQRFDKNKASLRPFQRGDYVLIKINPRIQTSLDLKYSEPYEILRVLDNDRYMVKRVTGRGRPRKVAHDQLRRAPQPGDQATMSAEFNENQETTPSQPLTAAPEQQTTSNEQQ